QPRQRSDAHGRGRRHCRRELPPPGHVEVLHVPAASVVAELEPLIAKLRQFVAERDWQQFHDPKNLAMLIASEAGELLAEYRWIRGDDADAPSRAPEPRARTA